MIFILFLFFIAALEVVPQTKDPDQIIRNLKEAFGKVKDYQVEVKIKVDVDFIKVPESHATIFYKQPGKMHFESENFALLPREGMDFSPLSLLKGEHSAIYLKEDNIDGHTVSVVKVIPLNGHGDIILNTFWIDQHENIIRRVETNTKINGSFSVDLKYDKHKSDYHLPSNMIFTLNLENIKMPKGIRGADTESDEVKKKVPSGTGKVYVSYFNYKVNQGLSDSIFEKKKKK